MNQITDEEKTMVQKLQAVFNAGAIFTYGQPQAPKTYRDESTQPLLSGCEIKEAHDGGAWIGITLMDGRRCKTVCPKQTAELREFAEKIFASPPEHIGRMNVHFTPVHGLVA